MSSLSIIIPVYNGEIYIGRLLDSITNQIGNKKKIEVIFVENGSSDNSFKLLKDYSKEIDYISVYQSKKGVSFARNLGISKANNDYLMFIDIDDDLLDGAIDTIIDDLKERKDLYMYGFAKGIYSDKIDNCNLIRYKYNDDNIENFIKWVIAKPTQRTSAWSKVYKKDIILNNDIFFKIDLCYSEDSEFFLRYVKKIKSFSVSKKCIYKYVLSEGSAMRSANPERINQYLLSMKYTMEEFNKDEYNDAINKYVLTHLNLIMVHDIFVYRKKVKVTDDIKKFKRLLNNSIFKKVLNDTNIIQCFSKELIVDFFLKIKLSFVAYSLCYLKSYINQK